MPGVELNTGRDESLKNTIVDLRVNTVSSCRRNPTRKMTMEKMMPVSGVPCVRDGVENCH